ncbi:MAG: hypothetical protein V1770_03985 [bacterium]
MENIGIKQLHANLKKITEDSLKGKSFIVLRKKYKLSDFRSVQFRRADKNLSKNIDKDLRRAMELY